LPSLNRLPRVCIIGGGMFGLSTAIQLDKKYDVTLFEQFDDILLGATYANHNRHHYGFHYPRSPETALQCLLSAKEFEDVYSDSVVWDFDNYYCVSKDKTKTTPKDYLSFCDNIGLEYVQGWPSEGVLDREKIALSLKVKEAVYSFPDLKSIISDRIKKTSTVKIKLNSMVLSGSVANNGNKELKVKERGSTTKYEFDFVINAMYANYNKFCDWFDLERREFQFNLQELDIIELPITNRLGITIQDGPFPSFLPIGKTNRYFLAHVETSQLIREISTGAVPLTQRLNYLESNWSEIQSSCSEYIPLLKNAKYIKSIFVDRVVDATRLHDDARLTDVINYKNGCWGIFAAKIITAEKTAKEIAMQIDNYS
jgi:hypothetical protein